MTRSIHARRARIGFALLTTVAGGALGGVACSGSAGPDDVRGTSNALDLFHRHDDVCSISQDGALVQQHVEVSGEDAIVGLLGLTMDRQVDTSTPGKNSVTETATLTFSPARVKVFSYTSTAAPDKPTTLDVQWGPLVLGARSASFVVDNGTMTGNIDGRQFAPFPIDGDPAKAIFTDGGPSPRLFTGLPMPLLVARLKARADAVAQSCSLPASATGTVMAALSAVDQTQDPGHISDTYGAGSCRACKYSVDAAAVAAGIACGVACAASFGLACGVCIAAGPAAVAAGMLACEQSGACCPTSCGRGIGATCCFGDEQCLNGSTGMCCSAGKPACAGIACCASDQSCIDQGPKKGTCCADSLVCGQNCCAAGDVCQNSGTGACCTPGKECGSTCCGNADSVTNLVCANAALGLCCDPGQVECGGTCCGNVQNTRECRNGQCVLKTTLDCGSQPACVDPTTGQQDPTVVCPGGAGGIATGFCDLDTGCCANHPA